MAENNSIRAVTGMPTNQTDTVAALRFLAAVCGQPRDTPLNDEEAHGMEVLLNRIADEVEGGAA